MDKIYLSDFLGTPYVRYKAIISDKGKEQTIGVGSDLTKAKEYFKAIEHLEYLRKTGDPLSNNKIRRIVEEFPDNIRRRLEDLGLLKKTNRLTLAVLIDEYFKANPDFSPRTVRNKETNFNRMRMFFVDDDEKSRIAESIRYEEAEEFKEHLADECAPATIAGNIKTAHALFAWAVKKRMLTENPFEGVSAPSMKNPQREYYVPPEDYRKILETISGYEKWPVILRQSWRTFLALCRIGGLRLAEAALLKWENVRWDDDLLNIDSTKTGKRTSPIWDGLRPELEELKRLQDESERPSGGYVLPDSWRRKTKHNGETILEPSNRRTEFKSIIADAGLKRWPRLFHNLRGSRANELWREHPELDVERWMGQSKDVADGHYINIRKEDVLRAIEDDAKHRQEQVRKRGYLQNTL